MAVRERRFGSENSHCMKYFQIELSNTCRNIFQNKLKESELPNRAMITDLNNDISNLKKENHTLVTRLEDLRKAVSKTVTRK